MHEPQMQVRKFMELFGQEVRPFPSVPEGSDAALRIALIAEEFNEFILATAKQDLVGVADALGDLLYVVYGAADCWGIDMEPIFEEIHRSNMTKVWEDGTVHRREDGKVIKPETYSPANLDTLITEQIRERQQTDITSADD